VLRKDNTTFLILKKDIEATKQLIGSDSFYSITKHLNLTKTSIPYFKKLINWEGSSKYFSRLFDSPIIFLLIICYTLAIFFQQKNWWKHLTVKPSIHQTSYKIRFVELSLFVVLFCVLTGLNKYYFLQDDNYIQFSPVITQSLTDFYHSGRWFNYNFYQNAGLPTAGYSIYSLNYFGTHFSFLVAKYIVNDVDCFATVFAFFHFFLGYFFLLKLLRLLNIYKELAVIAALCFVFSGYNVMASRSWFYIAPSIFYLPLLVFLRIKWHHKLTIKKAIYFGLFIGLYAYSGNVQYWTYTILSWLLLEAAYFLNKLQKLPWKFMLLSLAIGVLLFIPQLYITLLEVEGLKRTPNIGLDMFLGINEMLHPFNSSIIVVADSAGPLYSKYNWVMFKCCFLFGIITFAQLFRLFFLQKISKPIRPLLFLFFILLLYGCGSYGLIAALSLKLPFFSYFTYPFKIVLYLNFIIIVIGTYYLNQLKDKRIRIGILVLLFINLIWQISQSQSAFHIYKYKEPYKKPNYFALLDATLDYRVLATGAFRSFDENYAFSLQHNLATIYKIPSLDALEVLNSKEIDVINEYSNFSVRYVIDYKNQTEKIKYFPSSLNIKDLKNNNALLKIYEDSAVTLYENKNYIPLITCYNDAGCIELKPIIKYSTANIAIQYASKVYCSKVLLTLNYRTSLRIYVDDKPAKLFTDSLNRVSFFPNNPFNKIEARYSY
jgi:hypothetical protein